MIRDEGGWTGTKELLGSVIRELLSTSCLRDKVVRSNCTLGFATDYGDRFLRVSSDGKISLQASDSLIRS